MAATVLTPKTCFRALREFPHIAVCGAQRSGTNLTARIIAYELKADGPVEYRSYLEWPLNGWSIEKFLTRPRVVWHHPSLASGVLPAIDREDVAIVFVRRDLNDILASQNRIEWTGEGTERALMCWAGSGSSAGQKQSLWTAHWQDALCNPFEIQYESLAEHALWVPRTARKGWGKVQTKQDEEEWEYRP